MSWAKGFFFFLLRAFPGWYLITVLFKKKYMNSHHILEGSEKDIWFPEWFQTHPRVVGLWSQSPFTDFSDLVLSG